MSYKREDIAYENRKALAEKMREQALAFYECADAMENASTLEEFVVAVDLFNGRSVRYRAEADMLCSRRMEDE